MPIWNSTCLVITMKRKTKQILCTNPLLLIYILKKYLNESSLVFEALYHLKCQYPVLSANTVGRSRIFARSPCWYYRWQETQMYKSWVASSGMTFIPSFIKIRQLFRKVHGHESVILMLWWAPHIDCGKCDMRDFSEIAPTRVISRLVIILRTELL